MTTLPPIHREVIILISYRGKVGIEEVAQTTGVPVSTIKTRLHHARGHMAYLFAAAGKLLQHCKKVSQSPDPNRN